jgi:deoxyadenosine/deoxycytidine kinase
MTSSSLVDTFVPRIITIEGNIGAGKSTLVDVLKNKYAERNDVMFLQEPVDVWTKISQNGQNVLELFYGDQNRYSFAFQVLAYTTRLHMIEEAMEEARKNGIRVIVMERSLEADRNIFAKMLHDQGLMEDCMYQIYLLMSNFGLEKYKADGVLYVNAGPETCLERIRKRSREGEDAIMLGYLKTCDEYHKDWLAGMSNTSVFVVEDTYSEDLHEFLFNF